MWMWHQAPIDLLVEQITHVEFKAAFQVLAQAVMAQATREIVAPVNPNAGVVAAAMIRDFTKMNPPKFHGIKTNKYSLHTNTRNFV